MALYEFDYYNYYCDNNDDHYQYYNYYDYGMATPTITTSIGAVTPTTTISIIIHYASSADNADQHTAAYFFLP